MEVFEIFKVSSALIIGVGVYMYLKRDGFFDYGFKMYKKAYDEYQGNVLTKKKCYNRYVGDFVNGNKYFEIDSQRPNVDEVNMKNQCLLSLFDLLLTEEHIVAKYFSKDSFNYRVEYRDLIDEWNRYGIEESKATYDTPNEAMELVKIDTVVSLEDMILLDGEKKKMLLDKIGEYINTGVKGKRVAFMILALRGLGYLPEITSDRQLFTALKNHFNTYIGSDKSIYAYLDNGVSKQFKPDIDNLIAYFKVD